jgi:uncharacterized NAD(P)/FAD-binding protein YdhS
VTDPLVLTAEQTAMVAAVAAGLSPRWRARFTAAVGDLLTLHRTPTNADVLTAVNTAKRSICVGIGPPSMG